MEKAQKIIEIVEIKSFEGKSLWEVVFDLETTQKENWATSGTSDSLSPCPTKIYQSALWISAPTLFSEQLFNF